jgi:Cu/Ag efflux protein CusF
MNARLLAPLVSVALAACGAPESSRPASPPDVYEVRGEIVRLPASGSREISISHEAIPSFRDESGKVVGMEAMTMPFVVAEGVSTDGLAVGDPVAFTLEVRWKEKSPVRITKLAKATAIQSLDFESGQVPAPPEP